MNTYRDSALTVKMTTQMGLYPKKNERGFSKM